MYIILGATGHVGSAVAMELLKQGEQVTVITHDASKKEQWQEKGALVAIADVYDADQLRKVFRQGERLFILNPPAPITTDTSKEERKSVACILKALTDTGIEKIVAQSTYGAQPGDQIGDLGVLYELEQGLIDTGIPTSIVRGAYYMSNWEMSLATAQKSGQSFTLYPPEFKLPMVAPQDIGKVAARLLREPTNNTGLHYVEGPEQYSAADVAAAFSAALGKEITVVQTPPDAWVSTLTQAGFSQPAAESMAAMTQITLSQKDLLPQTPIRGHITLQEYIANLVSGAE